MALQAVVVTLKGFFWEEAGEPIQCKVMNIFSFVNAGEEPHSAIVASIVPGNPTLVTFVDDERLEFQVSTTALSFCPVGPMPLLSSASTALL